MNGLCIFSEGLLFVVIDDPSSSAILPFEEIFTGYYPGNKQRVDQEVTLQGTNITDLENNENIKSLRRKCPCVCLWL